ncbi:MAG: NADH-quinone oxidoreductase subunit NuoB [Azospirillum sp.]|nr:NADH-quinone oxidoreductase subunit NuoB [Azospirillum sp.]
MLKHLLKNVAGGPVTIQGPAASTEAVEELAARLQKLTHTRLGKGLVFREIDAGSCNGCELEIHALNNIVYDLERFGFRFAASPRHADVMMVTGPVAKNMKEALFRTWDAAPNPKWVVAVGDCACGTGVFAGSYACVGKVADVVPVDLHIKGCPPRPIDLLAGLIALIESTVAPAEKKAS